MGEENTARDGYTSIRVPERDDTYLEGVSGEESIEAKLQETTCGICGLSARTSGELQDHIENAHKKSS